MSAGQIDDTQPPHAQSGAVFDEPTLVVGAAVHDPIAHAVECGLFHLRPWPCIDDSGNSAHDLSSHARRWLRACQGRSGRIAKAPEAVVAIETGVPFPPVA